MADGGGSVGIVRDPATLPGRGGGARHDMYGASQVAVTSAAIVTASAPKRRNAKLHHPARLRRGSRCEMTCSAMNQPGLNL